MVEAILLAIVSALLSVGISWYWLGELAAKQARKQQHNRKDRLNSLIESTVGTTGETFFYALVRELSQFLSVDAVFLAVCTDDEKLACQTLSYWCDGGYIMNHAISMQNSPCGESGSFWYMENSAGNLFPDASLLQERFQTSGFFAIKLQDSSGQQIGLLAGMNRAALHPEKKRRPYHQVVRRARRGRTRAQTCARRNGDGKGTRAGDPAFHW